ncbi:phosphoribosyltransferase [Maribellus sediminis]|uniref:phosphoribosyltransferase n=1 Tax=Maribellus sediminis TaxID=2696285 RepID=UPI001431B403|nr:phosphoribosyltransferase [Maribellus sediminis]
MVPLSFQEIAARLKTIEFPPIDLVIGIGSGGVPAATMLAYHLEAELEVITLNYRDEQNNPRYEAPKILNQPTMQLNGKKILLVDDVSVSGKTMNAALELLQGFNVKTCAMKGNADFVLFPEIKDCVKWPWKP